MKLQSDNHLLARIAWNSFGWDKPSGDAPRLESQSYAVVHKFAHEEWLFREDWTIGGYRYGHIQGFQATNDDKPSAPVTVSLFAIDPKKKRRLVATIYRLEILTRQQAKLAFAEYRRNGWLARMRKEVQDIQGDTSRVAATIPAWHLFNVRYRPEDLHLHPESSLLPDTQWVRNRHRYRIYRFDESSRTEIAKAFRKRAAAGRDPVSKVLLRKATDADYYSPEHPLMQKNLLDALRKEYGKSCVRHEDNFVDVTVDDGKNLIFHEIKTDAEPRTVIRKAIGQLLEYAYHPANGNREPTSLVIVGRAALSLADREYLARLASRFGLPISYRAVPL